MQLFRSHIICLLLAVSATYFLVRESYPQWAHGMPYEFEDGYQPDAFEYYMPAANFALHNKFPYYGFMSAMSDYRIHPKPDTVKYFADTYHAGSMVFVSKPPLYSLLLGLSFKCFGFKPGIAILFNFYCFVITVFAILLIGYVFAKWKGLLLSSAAAIWWVKFFPPALFNCDAEMLTTALVVFFLLFAIIAVGRKKTSYYIFAGFVLALLLLTKGIFSFTVLFFDAWLFFRFAKKRTTQTLKQFSGFVIGFSFPLIVWMAYINPLLQSDIPNRLSFAEKLEATTPQVSVENYQQLFNASGKIREDVIENLNKFHQYEHARENSFVFTTNQNGKYNILNVHNEFCTDGDFHPEWRLVKTSFYHSCINDPNFIKLLKFYTHFPKLGGQITWAKFVNTKSGAAALFYFVLAATSVLFFFGKLQTELVPGYFLLLSVFLFLIILYGEIRFINAVLPVTLVLLCFVTAETKFFSAFYKMPQKLL